MIVDSSALCAILFGEAGAERLFETLSRDEPKRMSAASYVEVGAVVDARRDRVVGNQLDDLIRVLGIVVEPVTVEQALIARRAYQDYGRGSGHPARLNFGDCFSYALARVTDEAILFSGQDFSETDLRVVELGG